MASYKHRELNHIGYVRMQLPVSLSHIFAQASQRTLNIPEIAQSQKALLWSIIILTLSLWMQIPFLPVLTFVACCVFIFKLCKGLGMSSIMATLCVFTMFIGFFNLLILLLLNIQATLVLRRSGIHVGVMGAKLDDLR